MGDEPEERDRGIFTRRERKYLAGESDIEPASADERAVRATIRSHLENSILDFEYVDDGLEDRDRRAVIEDMEFGAAIEPLIGMVSMAYETADALGLDTQRIFSEGVQRAAERRGGDEAVVSLSLQVKKGLGRLHDRFKADDPTLTISEVGRLLRNDKITLAEAKEFNERAFGRANPGIGGVRDTDSDTDDTGE